MFLRVAYCGSVKYAAMDHVTAKYYRTFFLLPSSLDVTFTLTSHPPSPKLAGLSYSIFLRAIDPWLWDHISALKQLPAHHQGENPRVILRLRCCSFVFAILGTHKLQSTGDVRTEQHRSTPPCHQSNVEGAGRFQHGNNIYYTVYYIIRGRMYCNRIYRIYVYTIGCWVTRCICRLLRAKYINKWSYWRFLE